MSTLSVSLFGKLQIHVDGIQLDSLPPKKAQELLVYLLLYRRAHPREKLATLLWRGSTKRTKAYLRKALWQLRQSIDPDDADGSSVLRAEGDWVQIQPDADLWVDIDVFEHTFAEVRDCAVSDMTDAQVESLETAAELYTGDLLENWYQDWCLMERERYRDMFLRVLDRLTRCCEHRGTYDAGIEYCLRILHSDPARERTHRQLMRLRALAGNRTGALRQYERCAEVLDRELGVRPATATRRLHRQILQDTFPAASATLVTTRSADAVPFGLNDREAEAIEVQEPSLEDSDLDSVRDGIDRIRKLQSTIAAVQKQIRDDIEAVEIALQQRQDIPLRKHPGGGR